MNKKGFVNLALIVIISTILIGGSYFIFSRQEKLTNKNQDIKTIKVIQIKNVSESLGFGKYVKNPNNVPYNFIDARILTPTDSTSTQYYKLCGTDEDSAMSIFTKYLAAENHDIVLDDPQKTPEQKKQRMAEGYGTWHLVDHWKADTHYHYVISTAGESFWRHILLENCNYFTPTTKEHTITLGSDYSLSIGTFKYSPKTADSFLNFLEYYYGQGWTYITENKLHNVSIMENTDNVIISFKVALTHPADWGVPAEYTYHIVTNTLDKKTGDVHVSWRKIGTSASGHIDENLLK
ncbi:hypothetical protein HY404_02615 [Candidatus Microgenomates bacterium]|nr:hypothetical protein [Candidatus Microgenomates bacterium]